MKFTDYKFWYIKRNDEGFIKEVAVRFYEGEYQNKMIEGEEKEIYVRTKKLSVQERDLDHLADSKGNIGYTDDLHVAQGKDAVVYLPKHFGKIKTDEELKNFVNKEIAKDKGREPIREQKIWQH